MKKISLNPMAALVAVTIVLIVVLAASLTVITSAVSAEGDTGWPSREACTPSPASTETITVVDTPAHTTVEFDHWQRYSWTGGPHAEDTPPPFPGEDWQANVAGDPHGIGAPGAYYRSNGNSGKGDWFYLEMVMITVEHPAITHDEVIEHPAVECPPLPTDEPTDTPVVEPTPQTPVSDPSDTSKRHRRDAPLPDTGA